MGVYNATVITNAGQNLIASAIAGGQAINFTAVKTSTHVYPAGTALLNLTSLSDVKQTVAPTSVDVYNNNVVQISARVPNTGIATAYLINTIGLFGSAGGAETLIAVLTAQTPDEVPVFDAEAPAAFIFNIQMTIQNADEVVFEVNDTGTATVADLNRVAQPFTGATASAAGSVGRVPAPAAGANKKFLCGDGTWTAPADMVEDFTSSDVADGGATAWTSVDALTSGESNKNIFAKISQMFKNIRFLYKMLGTTDISSIGDGTVTKALSVLNANLNYRIAGARVFGFPDALYITFYNIQPAHYYGSIFLCVEWGTGSFSRFYPITGYDTTATDTVSAVKTYKHQRANGTYDFQIVFPSQYSHGFVVFGGNITSGIVQHYAS